MKWKNELNVMIDWNWKCKNIYDKLMKIMDK